MRAGRKEKLYKYGDQMITIKEASDIAGVTVSTMRARLTKCGGNMQYAIDGRPARGTGLNAQEEAAVEEIMKAIGVCEEAEPESEETVSKTEETVSKTEEIASECNNQQEHEPIYNSTIEMEEPIVEAEEDEVKKFLGDNVKPAPEEQKPLTEREILRLYNGCIAGMEKLLEHLSDEGRKTMSVNLTTLRWERAMRFDHLVDWDAYAFRG